MTLYAGMVVYNEEFLIDACLRSIENWVDKIIIIDGSPWGGSTDKTIEIAKQHQKVQIISGIYENERDQRQAYFDLMEKSDDNWCMKIDADECWGDNNMRELINRIKLAPKETMHFQFKSFEFYGDAWHYIERGPFGYGGYQLLGACRLMEGIRFYDYASFGVNGANWCEYHFPITIQLPLIVFFHYGYAQPFERAKEKALVWLRRGYKRRYGFEPWEEERYLKERFIPAHKLAQMNTVKFTGEHPKEIQHLLPLMTQND